MTQYCRLAALRSVVPIVFVAALAMFPAFSGASSNIWFSDHKSLRAIDDETNQFVRTIPLQQQPKALAVDGSRNVWAAFSQQLIKFSAAGTAVLEIEPGRFDAKLKHPRFLFANSYTGSVWVGAEHAVMLLSKDGQKTAVWQTVKEIEGIA